MKASAVAQGREQFFNTNMPGVYISKGKVISVSDQSGTKKDAKFPKDIDLMIRVKIGDKERPIFMQGNINLQGTSPYKFWSSARPIADLYVSAGLDLEPVGKKLQMTELNQLIGTEVVWLSYVTGTREYEGKEVLTYKTHKTVLALKNPADKDKVCITILKDFQRTLAEGYAPKYNASVVEDFKAKSATAFSPKNNDNGTMEAVVGDDVDEALGSF